MKFWFNSLIILICFRFERCSDCWRALDTKRITTDTINGIVCEADEFCVHCNGLQDYFAYGARERDWWYHEAKKAHPIISFLLLC